MSSCLVTLFALRGKDGCGTGDFGDLVPVIDTAVLTGLDAVVVCYALDETLGKGTPLHPVYIDPGQLPPVSNRAKAAALAAQAAELDALPQVNYSKAFNIKMHILRELYLQDGDSVLSSEGYHDFWKESREWLEHYSVFCTLRHKYGTDNNRYWSEPDYTRLLEDSNFIKEYSDDIRFHCYVQYLLHRQMDSVRSYARQKGVELIVSNAAHPASFRYVWATAPAGQRDGLYSRLGFTGDAPAAPQPWVAEAYVRSKLDGDSGNEPLIFEDLLAVTTLSQGLSPEREIVNPPFDQTAAWRYRMGISLEDILSHRALLECIRTIVSDTIK